MAVTVQKFPKQFKKQTLVNIDWRFSTILLLSLVFHVLLVVVLQAHLPKIMQPGAYTKIQKSYANLLVNEEIPLETAPAKELETIPIDANRVLAIAPGAAPGETAGEAAAPGSAAGAGAGTSAAAAMGAESRLPTAGEMAEAARGGSGSRRRTMSDVAKEVGNIGFLSILTSGSGYVPQEYIDGINSYSEAENERLGKVLASLDAMRVSRGPDGKGWGARSRLERQNPTGTRATRGTRRSTKALTVDQLVGAIEPTKDVKFKEIDRTSKGMQLLASNVQTKPPVPTTPEEKERLRRKPEFVRSVINGHRPAIMDCYKRVLRKNPNLRGKVEVRFAINSDGQVTWVEIVNSTIDDPDLTNCITLRIRHWNDFGYGDPTSPDEVYRQVFTFGY